MYFLGTRYKIILTQKTTDLNISVNKTQTQNPQPPQPTNPKSAERNQQIQEEI